MGNIENNLRELMGEGEKHFGISHTSVTGIVRVKQIDGRLFRLHGEVHRINEISNILPEGIVTDKINAGPVKREEERVSCMPGRKMPGRVVIAMLQITCMRRRRESASII